MTATAPADTSLRRIARTAAGLMAAMATPFTMLPLTPWFVVWFVDGVPPFGLLIAVGILLAPLPGLAMLRLSEGPRRTALVALGLTFLAIQLSMLVVTAPSWLFIAKSLALGTILSTIALWILVPSRAR